MNTFSKRVTIYFFYSLFIICVIIFLFICHKHREYMKLIEELNGQITEMKAEIEEKDYKIATSNELIKEYLETIKYLEDSMETEETEENKEVEKQPEFFLSDYQRKITECIVAGESMGEPYEGQVAVAECILNACLKDGLQPSEVRTKYKYSGWHNEPSESVKKAVSAVFDDGYKITDKFILYFYAPKYTSSSWHESQDFVMEIGGHRFFAEWDN